jgi:hypothetical protein
LFCSGHDILHVSRSGHADRLIGGKVNQGGVNSKIQLDKIQRHGYFPHRVARRAHVGKRL